MIVKNVIEREKEAVEQLCYTFAQFYKYPNEELYEEIVQGELDELLNDAFESLNINISIDLKRMVSSFQVLQQSYNECFSGVTHPFVIPVESVYKIWTKDPTAKVSIAKSKGYLMGDSAIHMQYLLKHYGMEIPRGYENMPDHLVILLEFYGYLQNNGTDQQLVQFLNDHFDWLDELLNELKEIQNSAFYVYITKILVDVIIHLREKE